MSKLAETIDLARLDIKLGDYRVGGATTISDPQILSAAQGYRRQAGSRMMPIGRADIKRKVPTADFHVSRKIDGEFTVLVFRDGESFSVNPGGTIRLGLPWLAEAAAALEKAGIKEAMFAGELYVHNIERRPRVHDVSTVARQPKSEADLQRLRFAVFDVIEIDGEPASESYPSTFQSIESLFGNGELVHPVETELANDIGDIEKLFDKWVEKEDAEGLVVRSDNAGLFKVKPRHTLDAVVIGFTESTEDRAGMMHDLLLAVARPDGTLQVLCRVGGGFSEDERRKMLSDLQDMVVSSEYAEVNSDYVAYKMVRPDWVIEISCLDLISKTTRGGDINRMVLSYDNDSDEYKVVRRLPLATVISPQFIRRREDKQAHPADINFSQVTDRVEVAMTDCEAKNFKLPTSEIVHREVYTKESKGNTMVRKFVVIKTNKEDEAKEYPAFVMHYTDFSPNRKAPLDREVMVSDSKEQILELLELSKKENIKKGWAPVGDSDESADEQETAVAVETKKKAAKKTATKKKAAKKTTTKKTATKKTTKKKAATKTKKASTKKKPK